jgi:hypothetical protein
VFPADEHVPVHGYQNVKNVAAHFDRLSEKGYKYNFIELSDVGGADGRAKEAVCGQRVYTAAYGIENKNETVGTVELGIQAHVLVHAVLQLLFLVFVHCPNDQAVEQESQNTGTWYGDEFN